MVVCDWCMYFSLMGIYELIPHGRGFYLQYKLILHVVIVKKTSRMSWIEETHSTMGVWTKFAKIIRFDVSHPYILYLSLSLSQFLHSAFTANFLVKILLLPIIFKD